MTLRRKSGLERLGLQSQITTIGFAVMLAVVALARSESLGAALVIAPSLLAVLVSSVFFVPGKSSTVTLWDIAVVLIGGATWLVVCITGMPPATGIACALAGAIVATKVSWRALAAVSFAAALLVPPLVFRALAGLCWIDYAIIQVVTFAVIVLSFLASAYQWHLIEGESRARHTAAALATAQERVRIANDLHDIQGHTLHVVNFKLAAAKVVLETDPLRAARELSEAQGLVAEAIHQSTELAFDRHAVQLRQELTNVARLFEAAGIDCDVAFLGSPTREFETLAAHVLREGATNILRHADASRVAIRVSEEGISVTNDGVHPVERGEPRSGGIAGLQSTFRLAGGELTAGRSAEGGFALTGRFAMPGRGGA